MGYNVVNGEYSAAEGRFFGSGAPLDFAQGRLRFGASSLRMTSLWDSRYQRASAFICGKIQRKRASRRGPPATSGERVMRPCP